jgi:WD repeat-containing protein 61
MGLNFWPSISNSTSSYTRPHIALRLSDRGDKVLYNSIEGLTSLWDLQSGEILGKHESYMRAGTDPAEPCAWISIYYRALSLVSFVHQ